MVRIRRLLFAAAVCAALMLGVASRAQGQAEPARTSGRIVLLFTMNEQNRYEPDMPVRPTSYHVAASTEPSLLPFGGSYQPQSQRGMVFTDADNGRHDVGKAMTWTSGVNDGPPNGVTLRFSSVGFDGMRLRFDVRSTKTGSPTVSMAYRVGGQGEYLPLGTPITLARSSEYEEVEIDLSNLQRIRESTEVEIVWVLAAGSGGFGNGTTRIDNIQITAEPRNR